MSLKDIELGEINMDGEIVIDAFAGIGYYTLP